MHRSPECLNLIRHAQKTLMFSVDWKSGHVCALYPPEKEYPMRLIHVGPKGFKPLKSYLKKYEEWKKSR